MKVLSIPRWRDDCFPYVMTAANGAFLRNRMDLYDASRPGSTTDGFDAEAIGYGAEGPVSPGLRPRLIDYFSERARRARSGFCIVFGERDCVHCLSDGKWFEAHSVPHADTLDSRDYGTVPYPLVDLWHAPLPAGSAAEHVCIRKLCTDRFEISSGAPCVLGYLDELDDDGADPAAAFLGPDGRLSAAKIFRGAIVTGVRDDRILMDPIQPNGQVRQTVRPWPEEVRSACIDVAKRHIPPALHESIWRIIDPTRVDINWVGVLRAA